MSKPLGYYVGRNTESITSRFGDRLETLTRRQKILLLNVIAWWLILREDLGAQASFSKSVISVENTLTEALFQSDPLGNVVAFMSGFGIDDIEAFTVALVAQIRDGEYAEEVKP